MAAKQSGDRRVAAGGGEAAQSMLTRVTSSLMIEFAGILPPGPVGGRPSAGGDRRVHHAALLHADDQQVHAGEHRAIPNLELDGLALVKRELRAVDEPPLGLDGDHVPLLHGGSGPYLERRALHDARVLRLQNGEQLDVEHEVAVRRDVVALPLGAVPKFGGNSKSPLPALLHPGNPKVPPFDDASRAYGEGERIVVMLGEESNSLPPSFSVPR